MADNTRNKRWHPELLGPITEPIFDVIVAALTELDDYPAYITGDDLAARIDHETGCNPKTAISVIDGCRRMGLLHGFRRIRPTTLGADWLRTHREHTT